MFQWLGSLFSSRPSDNPATRPSRGTQTSQLLDYSAPRNPGLLWGSQPPQFQGTFFVSVFVKSHNSKIIGAYDLDMYLHPPTSHHHIPQYPGHLHDGYGPQFSGYPPHYTFPTHQWVHPPNYPPSDRQSPAPLNSIYPPSSGVHATTRSMASSTTPSPLVESARNILPSGELNLRNCPICLLT